MQKVREQLLALAAPAFAPKPERVEITLPIRGSSAILGKKITLNKATGEVELAGDLFSRSQVEGVTKEMIAAVHNHEANFVDATQRALTSLRFRYNFAFAIRKIQQEI